MRVPVEDAGDLLEEDAVLTLDFGELGLHGDVLLAVVEGDRVGHLLRSHHRPDVPEVLEVDRSVSLLLFSLKFLV